MKKKYRVYFSYEAYAYVDVEAESEERAKSMVLYGDYDNAEIFDGSANEIDSVEEIKEETNEKVQSNLQK